MDSSFGHDFGRVRVHADAKAADAAEALDALAYTVGNDIVFGRERYAPHDAAGRKLLSHELAHVVQQQGASTDMARLQIGSMDDTREREAEAAAADIVDGAGQTHQLAALSQQVVQRQPRTTVAKTPPALQWDPKKNISAGVADSSVQCIGVAAADGMNYLQTSPQGSAPTQSLYPCGQNCVPVCAKKSLPLRFFFWVDGDIAPRPQPFSDSNVRLNLSFAPASAPPMTAARQVLSAMSTGKYVSPGAPLKTTFGTQVPFVPPEPGTLYVSAIIDDPTSGEVATYGDAIPVVDCPVPTGQNPPAKSQISELRTGTVIVVPDPVNTPLSYFRATGHDQVDPPGFYADLMQDAIGYFYYNVGFKYYIDYPPK